MAKSVMIQGAASDVGKSLLTAGLCRIFLQDGFRVAPFKSQNMALNSFVTPEGLEIGRAQAAQAEACRRAPDIRMNPVLLKPTGDKTSQVIVGGEPVGNMTAEVYFQYKKDLLPFIKSSYLSLAEENDIIVIEGAGSPAEINLNQNDIVNMGVAELAGAPVLLVGDIDRGGVFASLYGTFALLPEDKRRYVKAVIINKFRGDMKILEPGLSKLESLINIPVAGVVPYMKVDMDDEDGLSSRLEASSSGGVADIAVIRFPHISNFTDFNPLGRIKGVSLRYVSAPRFFGNPDIVILPGSKNTMCDLLWARETGLEEKIVSHARDGKFLIGVCGGYQMLSEKISDPEEAEGGGEIRGMGLLKAETRFSSSKTRTRTEGFFHDIDGVFSFLNGKRFKGYEIHMGETLSKIHMPVSTLKYAAGPEKPDGMAMENILGSYVHGLFDSPDVTDALIAALFASKGAEYSPSAQSTETYKEKEYVTLAEILRKSLNMDIIYDILNKGVK